ncbi:Uncharacterized protein TCM_019601 [Theobroma cacao]|uniref:Uncharacterized protein n=1 Tax=Theobroma cacao TaxID=3641 RepID=A0A061EHH8_THECC|nr:Uncharacterized protein TCM_019601 [Theobroma cacao]
MSKTVQIRMARHRVHVPVVTCGSENPSARRGRKLKSRGSRHQSFLSKSSDLSRRFGENLSLTSHPKISTEKSGGTLPSL